MEILVTPRLTLRPPIALDADDIAHWMSDWDVTKMLARVPWPYFVEHAEGWLAQAVQSEKKIFTIHQNCLIGVVSLEGDELVPELGYWLAKPWHGRGFMREALTCVLDRFFAQNSSLSVQSSVFIDNPVSIALQVSLGFEIESEIEINSVARQTLVPAIKTRLTRDRWLNRNKARAPNPQHQQQSSQIAA